MLARHSARRDDVQEIGLQGQIVEVFRCAAVTVRGGLLQAESFGIEADGAPVARPVLSRSNAPSSAQLRTNRDDTPGARQVGTRVAAGPKVPRCYQPLRPSQTYAFFYTPCPYRPLLLFLLSTLCQHLSASCCRNTRAGVQVVKQRRSHLRNRLSLG